MKPEGGDSQLLRELVAAVAAGDRAAFTELYDLTSSRSYGLAVRIVVDRHYAEEIVQEAYLQYGQNAGDYNPARGSVITWIITIEEAPVFWQPTRMVWSSLWTKRDGHTG
jgi:RNA polymerase sigma-70 factor (ECF subfamily)